MICLQTLLPRFSLYQFAKTSVVLYHILSLNWFTCKVKYLDLNSYSSINVPYKLVKSYKTIKDQCGFLSHSNFETDFTCKVKYLYLRIWFWLCSWLIHVSKLAYDFKIIGTMTKLRQVSEPIFAARNFLHRLQVDIIPWKLYHWGHTNLHEP